MASRARSASLAAVALRLAHVLWVLVRLPKDYLAHRWKLRREPNAALRGLGRALVAACTELGATFIKVGQILSARRDLLPAPLADELATLQDRVPPFPFAQVREIVEEELGRPIADLFDAFDPNPVAAASIAQVHRAVWRKTGETVAVKVRRPDVLEKIQLDRALLLAFARWGERWFPSLRLAALEQAVARFCEAAEKQAHLRVEAQNNRRFRQCFATDPDIVFPALIEEACTDRVLTMEFVDGHRTDALPHPSFDQRRVVEAGVRAVGRMVFRHGFVHADLHPGNLRFLPPHRIAIFDLGLVAELDEADRLMTARTLYAFATGDGVTVARLFYENAPHRAVADYQAYEAEMVALVEDLRSKQLAAAELSLDIGRIFDVLRRHHIQARSHMTMVNVALVTAEGLGKRLDPALNLAEAALPFIVEALAAAPAIPRSAELGEATRRPATGSTPEVQTEDGREENAG